MGTSRDAVAAVADRLDLPSRRRRRTSEANEIVAGAEVATLAPPDLAPEPGVTEAPAVPPAPIMNFLDLPAACCRWITGDLRDGGFYCAVATGDSLRPWCSEHRARVYVARPR